MQITMDYYDSLERWGQDPDEANQRRIEATIQLVPPDARTILDAGCGDGSISNALSRANRKVISLDISQRALQFVEADKLQGEINFLPFPGRSFDLVLSAQVLEHLPEEVYPQALAEIARVARRYIIISTPNEEHLPASYTRCEQCGCTFHVNFHTRTFNREIHKKLFSPLLLFETTNVGTWQQNRYLTNIQHLLGIYRYKTGIPCPVCKDRSTMTQPVSKWRWLVWRGVLLISKFLPKRSKPRWIISLYVKPDER